MGVSNHISGIPEFHKKRPVGNVFLSWRREGLLGIGATALFSLRTLLWMNYTPNCTSIMRTKVSLWTSLKPPTRGAKGSRRSVSVKLLSVDIDYELILGVPEI